MSKVYIKDGQLCVPDRVTVPYIEGDGVGAEITPVCQRIVNAAVELAYLGKRSIEWKEVLAGGKAFQQTGECFRKQRWKHFVNIWSVSKDRLPLRWEEASVR